MVLIPDVLGQVLADEGLGALGELRPAGEIFWLLEVSSAHDSAFGSFASGTGGFGLRDTLGGVAAHCCFKFLKSLFLIV